MRLAAVLSLLLAACSPPEGDGRIDARAELPDPGEGNLQYLSEEMEIPALSERMFCTFFTYEGPDTAIVEAQSYQDPDYGHHVFLLKTIIGTSQAPDGYVMDCTSTEDFSMAQADQIYIPQPEGPGRTGMELPEGMAVKLESGTRLLLQSHYINYESAPIVAQDGVNFTLADPADVETWAAPFAHTTLDIDLPPGEETTLDLNCGWEEDVNLLFLIGHMHEYGEAFSVDRIRGEEVERIYEVPHWTAWYRDNPPVTDYEPGEFVVKAGDVFHTTCSWDNTSDETLHFPSEMCATVGIAYPAEEPLYCAEF